MSNRIQKEGFQDGSPEEAGKCPVCRLMYGHASFDFLCSHCYRQSQECKKIQQYSCRAKAEKNPAKEEASPSDSVEPLTEKQESKAAELDKKEGEDL